MNIRLDDKAALTILRDRMDKALATIKGELGLTKLRTGRISYERGGTSCRITVEAEVTVNGKTKAEQDFETYATIYGLKPEHLHSTFAHRGNWYEVMGFAPTRRKFPIIGRIVGTNQRFFFPLTIIPKLKVKEVTA